MKKLLAILASVLLLATMIPMGAVSVSAAYDFLFPVNNGGKIAYVYGYSASYGGEHTGIDIHSNGDDTIYAAAPGKVVATANACPHVSIYPTKCEHYNTFGNYIKIQHDDGTYAYYGHLKQNSLKVSVGQRVSKGNPIASMGSSGYSSGKHLHFEVRLSNGTTRVNVNPVSGGGSINYSYSGYGGEDTLSYATIATGTYFIQNNKNKLYMNVSYGLDENAQNIHTYDFGPWDSQRFEITPSTTTDGYMMRPLSSTSRVVNVYADNVVSGKNVCIYNNTGDGSQRWYFEKVKDGFVIRNVQNPSCVLDVAGGDDVGVQTYTGADSQIWMLQNAITYDANGGTGAPARQMKNYGESITLSKTIPTKEGYTFQGWATSADAKTAQYAAGAQYSNNASVTLYAVWQANTLKVSYHANGGTIAVDGYMLDGGLICNNDGTKYYQTWTYNNPKTNGLINRGTLGLARDGYSFMGWGTSPDGGVIFDPDNVDLLPTDITSEIKVGSCSVTLYAIWKCNHVYDNACDTTCNTCGATRSIKHSYSAATCTKPETCTVCGKTQGSALGHKYDDDYDASCNTCGAVREVPQKPPVTPELPADAPTFVVENVSARAGQEFTVAIRTQRNSGIMSLKLNVAYDSNVLELVNAVEQDFAGASFSPLSTAPFVVNWFDALHPNNTTNGVVALLTFRVKADALAGTTEITLSYDAADVFDKNYQDVAFRIEDGVVEIVDYVFGDVNDDGAINNKDLAMLQQYVNKWGISINVAAADVNVDGAVNNKDLALLQQYINKWDVQLGK